ncbi:MAG TPA: hypothetical protein PKM48_09425 [Parvularculaceae bacterium]|nr:hypothetical protein [Parvularculaceae bacterium]HNS86752.1 hypothetical protein [Parvularculaceae bacterium]
MPNADELAVHEIAGDKPGFLKRYVSFFRIALLFAVAGQPLAGLALHLLKEADVIDFARIDPGAGAAFHILAATFIFQIILILIALARIGTNLKRLTASIAVLVFAFASVMILFVMLQCDLYDACL